ncbi:MAG: hypothetical protein QM679_10835 [Patulibacter sp.]
MSSRSMRQRTAHLILWSPVAVAVLYLLQLVRTFGTVRDSLASHADFASAPVLAQLMSGRPPGSVVLLGDYRWFEALWLMRGTQWLPWHMTMWELVPFALWIVLIAAVYVAVRRISTGRWAALTAAALVICGGTSMRNTIWSLNTHGPAAVHAAILGLTVVLLAGARQRPTFARWAIGSSALLVPVTAFGATDPLLLTTGVAPFALACLALAWRTDDWVAGAYGLVVAAGSTVGAKVLLHLGDAAGLGWTHRAVSFVRPDAVLEQLEIVPSATASLVSRSSFGEQLGLASGVAIAGGLLALATGAIVLRSAGRAAWAAVRSAPDSNPAPDHLAPAPDPDVAAAAQDPSAAVEEQRRLAARDAFLVFWVAAASVGLAQFVFTNAAIDYFGARYLIGTWVAICALLPVVAELRGTRVVAAGAGAAIAFVAFGQTVANPKPTRDSPYPSQQNVAELLQFAREAHVTSGYAGFWDAIPITWQSRFKLKVYPLYPCAEGKNCPMYQHQISSWYAPGDEGRRMLIVDPRNPTQPNVDEAYGEPIIQRQVGPMTVYVYASDLAAKL